MGMSNVERQRRYRERRKQRSTQGHAARIPLALYVTYMSKPSSSSFRAPAACLASALVDVLATLPKQYRIMCSELTQYLMDKSDMIRVSNGGRVVIDDQIYDDEKFVDAMRSLYLCRTPFGLSCAARAIVRKLHSIGVPSYLISSPTARTTFKILDGVQHHASSIMCATSDVGD